MPRPRGNPLATKYIENQDESAGTSSPEQSGVPVGVPPNEVALDVRKQITSAFRPAAQDVISAGSGLLQALQKLSKTASIYVRKVEVLAEAGNSAYDRVKPSVNELVNVGKTLKEIHGKHKTQMDKLRSLLSELKVFNAEIDEKMKDWTKDFRQKEKDMKMAIRKNQKNQGDLQQTYEKQMNSLLEMQNRCFQTYAEKQLTWLHEYSDILRTIAPPQDDKEKTFEEKAEPKKEEEQKNEAKEKGEQKREMSDKQENNKVIEIPHVQVMKSPAVPSAAKPISLGIQTDPNELIKSGIMNAGKEARHTYVNLTPSEDNQTAEIQVKHQSAIYPAPGIEQNGPAKVEHQLSPVTMRKHNINAVPTPFVPPIFSQSDVGKTLVCIHEFEAQSADQLSLHLGEEIVLIKCGSKGWIFSRSKETERTGWCPSRFVKMGPDNSNSIAT